MGPSGASSPATGATVAAFPPSVATGSSADIPEILTVQTGSQDLHWEGEEPVPRAPRRGFW